MDSNASSVDSNALEFHFMGYDYLFKDDWPGTVTISDEGLAKRKFYKTLTLGVATV